MAFTFTIHFRVTVIVHSDNDELQLGVDESYSLLVTKSNEHSIIGGVSIEANSVYSALRGLEGKLIRLHGLFKTRQAKICISGASVRYVKALFAN
ncbi:hypothetical protein K7X08_030269 [Anisodus acutangulus]|uniref:Beta-hexosaminidase eukaryotic type N-terminal domain-containing protein n=1 Tax=Anisodus acutangulus TaxID=402998 RepID=A0A9Q1LPZ4_9SOLA|nr:hypothetical protein K7X08_030269 [Anisodus acutangulus]